MEHKAPAFDSPPTLQQLQAASVVLRGWRAAAAAPGGKKALDLLVDEVTPRTLAHIVEEIVRSVSGGPLWKFTLADRGVIAKATDVVDDMLEKASNRATTKP